MSEKEKKKPSQKSGKAKGNQKTKRRREAQKHAKMLKEGKTPPSKQKKSSSKIDTSQSEKVEENSETKTPVTDHIEMEKIEKVDQNELSSKPDALTTKDDSAENITTEQYTSEDRNTQVEELSYDQNEPSPQDVEIIEPVEEIDFAEEGINDKEVGEMEIRSDISEDDMVETDLSDVEGPGEGVEEQQILSIEIEEDIPSTSIGQSIKSRMSKGTQRMDVKKFLLPREKHLTSKMVVYFGEGQIFLGFAIFLFSFISYLIWYIPTISLLLFLSGSFLMTTGYVSEELHITNSRILLRRMNWVDRIFRIPQDSQYILDEIVAFDVQRAPPNQVLVATSILTLVPLAWEPVRTNSTLLFIIIIVSFITLLSSQRLGKRTISFLMSGGHQVFLGQYKGIPNSVVESFTDIIMEKNIFESDEY